ncbi:DUF2510 domain-containing protein [Protaetiibacter larvae]|uniref:DUF2510 domain-containing protein n=1 Tax=Protaetiibacter larvae TaxID=2592654 RepID=A0A5C1Y6Z1_9MICO|nr:DUF2510 domain-containing protein [Protaetiibacter larvae]QEO09208.1 DUF2510 domain-containing protein [Protaetiibacter larvae]
MTGAFEAAGWRDDPADPARQRWWDGFDWTEHTRLAPIVDNPAGRRPIGREPIVFARRDRTAVLGWIGWSPLWIGAAPYLLWLISANVQARPQAAGWIPVTFLLGWAALLLLAHRDRRELQALGWIGTPNPRWALLGSLPYLIARRRALHRDDGDAEGTDTSLFATTAVVLAIAGAALVLWMGPQLIGMAIEVVGDQFRQRTITPGP